MAWCCKSSQVNLVDACIIGLPPNESRRPTLLVAGRDLEPLMSLDSIAFDIAVIDDCVGSASAMKVTQDALSKGVNAFLTLVFLAAERQGILDTFVDVVSRSHPDLLARAKRSIPWIPADVDRFISEMDIVKEMLDGLDLPSSFALAAREILQIYRASRFAEEDAGETGTYREIFAKLFLDLLRSRERTTNNRANSVEKAKPREFILTLMTDDFEEAIRGAAAKVDRIGPDLETYQKAERQATLGTRVSAHNAHFVARLKGNIAGIGAFRPH